MMRGMRFLLLWGCIVSYGAAAAAQPATRLQASRTNPFAAQDWTPPVAKVKPVPPPPPRAPALPFVYLGKMLDGADVTAFVSQGGRNYALRSGDTVASYQVDSVSPTEMVFVYVPLGEKQRLAFGSEN